MVRMTLATPALHTARLRLRPFAAADADRLYALHSSAHVMRYWDSPPWTDRARADRFIAVCRRVADEGTGHGWPSTGPLTGPSSAGAV